MVFPRMNKIAFDEIVQAARDKVVQQGLDNVDPCTVVLAVLSMQPDIIKMGMKEALNEWSKETDANGFEAKDRRNWRTRVKEQAPPVFTGAGIGVVLIKIIELLLK